MEATVRDAVISDLDAICRVYEQSSLSNPADREILLRHPELFEHPPAGLSEGRTRVALSPTNEVIGFASTQRAGDVLEIEDLFVAPAWMRRGVGSTLVLDVFAIARRRRLRRVEVTANPAALVFYERLGFRFSHLTETQFAEAPRLFIELT